MGGRPAMPRTGGAERGLGRHMDPVRGRRTGPPPGQKYCKNGSGRGAGRHGGPAKNIAK